MIFFKVIPFFCCISIFSLFILYDLLQRSFRQQFKSNRSCKRHTLICEKLIQSNKLPLIADSFIETCKLYDIQRFLVLTRHSQHSLGIHFIAEFNSFPVTTDGADADQKPLTIIESKFISLQLLRALIHFPLHICSYVNWTVVPNLPQLIALLGTAMSTTQQACYH